MTDAKHAQVTLTIYNFDQEKFPSENDLRRAIIEHFEENMDFAGAYSFSLNGIDFLDVHAKQTPYPVFSEKEPCMVG